MKRRTIFVSYAHDDEAWTPRLLAHLSTVVHRDEDVVLWHDRTMSAGVDWRDGIDNAIDDAAVALLLISPEFFASTFIRKVELPRLKRAARDGHLKVIPIILEPCAWETEEWIAKWNAVMHKDQPLAAATAVEVDTVFANLAKQLVAELAAAPVVPRRKIQTNIVASKSSFVGRTPELENLKQLLRTGDARLVTIGGSAGLGKTRLARELGLSVLDASPGGCWFVDLVLAVTLTGIAHAVAQVFDVSLTSSQISDQDVIVDLLQERERTLLILDNFEQVVELADESVGYWLERLPDVCFVVTSRARLGLAEEQEYWLDTLTLPPPDVAAEELVRYESSKLFVDRAKAAWPKLTVDDDAAANVARICRELQGIPLAIELAAANARALSIAEIANRLESLLQSSRRDAPDRQRTLTAAVDWSFNLLSEPEQQAFLQLCIFRGGFDLPAAEAVLGTRDAYHLVQALID